MGWTSWIHRACRLAGVAAVFGLAACSSGRPASPPALPTLLPLMIPPVLSELHLCAAVPAATVEAVLGRKLVRAPDWFQYPDAPGSAGCQYDAGQDGAGNALFAYIALTTPNVYDQQPRYQDQPVSGIGDAAYFNNGPDARQLWVKLDTVAVVVAIGDAPNEAGLKQLATLLVDAIRAAESNSER
ncbi:MAG: hypothetical protein RMN25_05845 [Anaerolineae bacterium]|nr:hypothetical protein [Thermoflexales bacterium]MDW8407288.1 hypothetical protein [Anaerolineae bacterium]